MFHLQRVTVGATISMMCRKRYKSEHDITSVLDVAVRALRLAVAWLLQQYGNVDQRSHPMWRTSTRHLSFRNARSASLSLQPKVIRAALPNSNLRYRLGEDCRVLPPTRSFNSHYHYPCGHTFSEASARHVLRISIVRTGRSGI